MINIKKYIDRVIPYFMQGKYVEGYKELIKAYNHINKVEDIETKRFILYNMSFCEDEFYKNNIESGDIKTANRYREEAKKHIKEIKDIMELEENEWYLNRHREKYINVISNYRHIFNEDMSTVERLKISKQVYVFYKEIGENNSDMYMATHNYLFERELYSRCIETLKLMLVNDEYDDEKLTDILADLKSKNKSAYIEALEVVKNYKSENSLQVED